MCLMWNLYVTGREAFLLHSFTYKQNKTKKVPWGEKGDVIKSLSFLGDFKVKKR